MIDLTKLLLKNQPISIAFILLGLFPIFPFNLKPVIVGVVIAISVFYYFKRAETVFSNIYLFNGILFILYGISFFYSQDKVYALKRLETSLSLVLLPIFFILLSSGVLSKKTLLHIEKVFFKTFYFSVLLMSIVIYIYICSLGYFNGLVSYSFCLSYIEHRLWVFNDHPIYISIFLAIALIFSIRLYKSGSKYIKALILIGDLVVLSTLFFLSRKGVIIALIISFIFLAFKTLRFTKIRVLYLAAVAIFMAVFFFISSSQSKRFKEIFNQETYTNSINENLSSTSIRFGIYKCAVKQIPQSGFFGFGIGDVKHALQDCYQETSALLVNKNYNTHNQYLNTILATGVIGLLIFCFSLFMLFRFSINRNDYIFTAVLIFYSIALLTENILDRQNGIILFSILINYFTFQNILKIKFDE
ncbi:O-antigen ligase family protein [Tamlana haliotis]|uniref:O-antigen ligase family protein n=1 Tax=Pseudotamlana haliotis TaxID=2614804 RepID=A0A6N6M8D0_9FLAO|nr:O-antigen ligase family protein [Tamlana haliotis]KAB1066522.1 O-antigen ligase family protein [Tamlana haliotis]